MAVIGELHPHSRPPKSSNPLGKPLDEVERRTGHVAPAVVDREGVAPVRDLHDLRHGGVAPLALPEGAQELAGGYLLIAGLPALDLPEETGVRLNG